METRAADIVVDGRTVVTARPIASGPWPGVVMLHEGWGIDDVLRRHADRLAAAGYLVYAPDLLGEGSWLRCIRIVFKAYQTRAGKPFELIESCRTKLQADADCTGKVGVIGFCMGGGFALLLSAEGYHAASVNYGPMPADIDKLAEHSRRTARCRGLSRGRSRLSERQTERAAAFPPSRETDARRTRAGIGSGCMAQNRGLLRRASQLVMSLRRKYQKANHTAMMA